MKWNRSALLAAVLLTCAVGARGDLGRWIQDIAAPNKLQAVFFRSMALPAGPIEVRRPPKETRPELATLIAASPSQAGLYLLRAHEDELQLDFGAAEADWKKYVELAPDKIQAGFDLADYYHRRLEPRQEIAALEAVGRAATPVSAQLKPADRQPSWVAWARIQNIIESQALGGDLSITEYQAWTARYPAEPAIYRGFFSAMLTDRRFDDAARVLAAYRQVFPSDAVSQVQLEAELAEKRESSASAAQVYDRAFQPLWPQELIKSQFDLLTKTHGLRRYLDQARAQAASEPAAIAPVAKLFYYYRHQNNPASAQRVLYEYRRRKQSYTADELWTLGHLFELAQNGDEAARSYYDLYNLNPPANQQRSLVAISILLLNTPEQPMRFGAGDLSMYRDIATMDPGPGFLNGILSLLLNSTVPRSAYDIENQASRAYFHRAQASQLIAAIDQRYPSAPERSALHSQLISAYAVYGDDSGILRAGEQFLKAFPNSPERTSVALTMADAYARRNQTAQEFSLYDVLLKELAARADNVPLGENAVAAPAAPPPPNANDEQANTAPPARSLEYARVLDRYIGRLVVLKRLPQALQLYRGEIARNPNDPGLYERLAGFLDQNKMGSEVEQVYRQAMAQFPDRSWSHKLARWYLRRKQNSQFDALTREVVQTFSGTELESYLSDATQGQRGAPALFKQVNVYAHQRFPYNLTFVRNLLAADTRKETLDPIAAEALLRQYWFYAPDLRDRFFEYLARSGKLKSELATLARPDAAINPAGAQFAAEAQAWQSHFELAAPLMQGVAADFPGSAEYQLRAASLYRSLATEDLPGQRVNTETAVALAENIVKASPRDSAALIRVGEIYADRELFQRAAPYWDRVATIEPGNQTGYLDSATVFWDYFRFDDALRLIVSARQKLHRPHLYSFEAGAIYENQRDYSRAIHEYADGALAEPVEEQSKTRLVKLSLRSDQRPLIDDLTAKAATGQDASQAAVSLRISILEAQGHSGDLRQFLLTSASASNSLEVLHLISSVSETRGLDDVREQAQLREISLTADPVEKMQQQIALVHFYEGRHNSASAERTIDGLYKANPAVLGVVRATVDYYWRNKEPKRAVDILEQAGARSQPAYRNPLLLEAARKATESGDYVRAREIVAALLKKDPYQPEYVVAMAETYSRQADDRGLRDFYNERLKALSADSLGAAEKVEKTSALRRGLIPVLTRLKDYAGAIDQYVELLNRYPEDAELTREAARYAVEHGRSAQLAGYYESSARQSPRDFRWPMVLARIDAQLENFGAAVTNYQVAANLRPDRIDFYTERAGLEERLLRFDEAASTYTKLFELSYHNSQWMEHVATIRARQGNNAAAVKALNSAYIEGRPPTPDAIFTVAQRLESWDMLTEAASFADRAVIQAGSALLTEYPAGAQTWMRIMTRKREYQSAWQKLSAIAKTQPAEAVKQPLQVCQTEMGTLVSRYFTPEEKTSFAAWIGVNLQTFRRAIEAAGLMDLEAKADAHHPQQLITLQQRRLAFEALGAQLEAYWKQLSPQSENRDTWLEQAAENYRLAGTSAAELRVLALLAQQDNLKGAALTRYAELLLNNPVKLDAVVSSDPSEEVRDAVANFAVRSGDSERALRAIAARAHPEKPVWLRAYTALTGFYFALDTSTTRAAFEEALGAGTIGERLGKPVDRDQLLAGDLWFYYGSRYGEYLADLKKSGAEDYLPASVEGRPASADAYFELGEYYRFAGRIDRATEEYRHALQLDANRIDAHDRLAIVLTSQANAIEEFRQSLAAAGRQQDSGHMPPSFWTDLANTLEDIGKSHLLDPLRGDAERVLRTYIRRNGDFQVQPLLEAAYHAAGSNVAGVQWVLELSTAAPERTLFLASIANAQWIADAARPAVYRALLDAARVKPELVDDLRRAQLEFAAFLVEHNQPRDALTVLAEIPADQRQSRLNLIIPLEIRIAAETNTLAALLNRYRADPDLANRLDDLQQAANELEQAKKHAAAQQVLIFTYERNLELNRLDPATFLGLAKIRLEQNDLPAALALLRRMTMVAGEPFENLISSASLLLQTGHTPEAIPFLEARVTAVPWDTSARLELAKANHNVPALTQIAQSNESFYDVRAKAARALAEQHAAPLNSASAEINLLSNPQIAPAAAQKPYYYYARIDAAAQTPDPSTKILLLRQAIAIAPTLEPSAYHALIRAALDAKRWQLAVSTYQFSSPHDLSFALPVARAEEALGDLEAAHRFYQEAQDSKDVLRVQAILDRRTANDRRAPRVSSNLEQDHPVRPRLTASSQVGAR